MPIIQETWHTQFHTWGFGEPIHPDWDADKVVEIIITDPPFALFDGTGHLHSIRPHRNGHPYPQRRLWWLVHPQRLSGLRLTGRRVQGGFRARVLSPGAVERSAVGRLYHELCG